MHNKLLKKRQKTLLSRLMRLFAQNKFKTILGEGEALAPPFLAAEIELYQQGWQQSACADTKILICLVMYTHTARSRSSDMGVEHIKENLCYKGRCRFPLTILLRAGRTDPSQAPPNTQNQSARENRPGHLSFFSPAGV